MTPVQHTIQAVEWHVDNLNPPHWRVFYRIPGDGGPRTHCHAFPESALGWRAAEYGIDPSDVDTLLDVVLHEPHMVGHDHTSPDFLYNTTRVAARVALHNRVSDVKRQVQLLDPDNHLSQIKLSHKIDPDGHAQKVAYVDYLRTYGHAPAPEPVKEIRHG